MLSGAGNLKFASGSATLDKKGRDALKGIAKTLNKFPDQKMRLVGYSDNQGAKDVNIELSGYRADAVREQLILYGVDAERIISTRGLGPKDPIADNGTENGRAKNRRVEIQLAD